jgi:PAS domain S-box-containing protein
VKDDNRQDIALMITVLYVDDEVSLLELAKEFLEASNDIILETATNVPEAMKKIHGGGIDVIVSDYMMPSMDGLAFLRSLRESGNSIPFILFTGKGREEVVIQALNEGADSYIQKGGQPVPQFAELAHRITRAAERYQVVLALQRSEARLKRAEEIAGFGHWELHLDSKMMYSSSGTNSIYGVEEGLRLFELVKKVPLPEYRSMLDNALHELISKGAIYDVEFKIQRLSDGKILDVHSRAEYDPVHRIVFGVIQDITARKRAETEISLKNEELEASYVQMSSAEEELRAAQHQISVAMDMAKLVYWDMDMVRGLFIFNDRFYSLYGTTAEKEGGYLMKIDVYLDEFVHPDDRSRVAKVIENNLSSTIGINQLEHRIIRRDGQIRDILVCTEMDRDLKSIPFHAYGANQDITERKKAEVALERANRKLSLLNSITRHDITNQITILRGNLEMAKGSVTDRETVTRLEKVDRSSRIILDHIRFTKEYQDMGTSAPVWNNLSEMIFSNPQVREASDLSISDEAARLSFYADPMLPKVFNNLIENTMRYAAKPASIAIYCEQIENGVMLVYEDVGPGIPGIEKEKIFHKGFGKGSGLGLFLSREILAITGISIHETGTPGRGVRFEISIPSSMIKN